MIRYDSIIFDLDGTLWNASEASASGWNAGLKSCGVQNVVISAQDIKTVSGRPFLECVKILLPEVSAKENSNLAEAIDSNEEIAVQSEGGAAYEGVVDGVRTLAGRYPLFLVSNCQEWYLTAFWNHIPIAAFFRASNCYGRSRASKAEMIRETVGRFGLRNPVYIGDTDSDQQASRSAKVDFGYVTYGFGKVECPALEFQSFGELVDWFSDSSAA